MEITESKYVKTSEFDISSEMEVLIGTWVGKNDVFSVAMFDCRDLNWPPTSGNMEVYIANKRSQKKNWDCNKFGHSNFHLQPSTRWDSTFWEALVSRLGLICWWKTMVVVSIDVGCVLNFQLVI